MWYVIRYVMWYVIRYVIRYVMRYVKPAAKEPKTQGFDGVRQRAESIQKREVHAAWNRQNHHAIFPPIFLRLSVLYHKIS